MISELETDSDGAQGRIIRPPGTSSPSPVATAFAVSVCESSPGADPCASGRPGVAVPSSEAWQAALLSLRPNSVLPISVAGLSAAGPGAGEAAAVAGCAGAVAAWPAGGWLLVVPPAPQPDAAGSTASSAGGAVEALGGGR